MAQGDESGNVLDPVVATRVLATLTIEVVDIERLHPSGEADNLCIVSCDFFSGATFPTVFARMVVSYADTLPREPPSVTEVVAQPGMARRAQPLLYLLPRALETPDIGTHHTSLVAL